MPTGDHVSIPSPTARASTWRRHRVLLGAGLLILLRDELWAAYGPEIQQALRDDLIPEQASLPLDPDEPF